jgi:hypothetical protein
MVAMLLIGLLGGQFSTLWVSAQDVDSLIVLPPNLSAFPVLSVHIKPHIESSVQTLDLQIEDLTVVENGRMVTVVALEKIRSGVHFTLAINGDRRLDVRDADGNSPYARLQEVFFDWARSRRFATGDTLSLVTQEAALIRNTPDREAWIQALADYQPNFRGMTPDLASLETALRFSEERVVPFGVDKALLYITPPPTPQEINPIITLTETARIAGIQVHVWMMGEEYFLYNDQGGALINLAERTGGQFFHYTGIEALPDPESYLENLGVYYDLRYETAIRESGTYTLRVTVALPGGELSGESGEYLVDIQPPKPILLSPPAVIERQPPSDWDGDLAVLTPVSFEVAFILEFQDQYPRELVVSQLYVDGQVADQRTEAPFDVLTWDLTPLIESGEHIIQVAVEDSLGLSGETILTPIQIEVQIPEPEPPLTSQDVGLIVIGVILTATLILLIVWLMRHFLQGAFAQRMAKKIFDSKKKLGIPGLAAADSDQGIYANLIPLGSFDLDDDLAVMQIKVRQTTFGSDPERVTQVLEGEGIDGFHARLRVKDGEFWLHDHGSDGGTWVNYALIGRDPVQIHPGDLIHFGSLGFRFTIIDVESPPKAKVVKYEPII